MEGTSQIHSKSVRFLTETGQMTRVREGCRAFGAVVVLVLQPRLSMSQGRMTAVLSLMLPCLALAEG